MPVGKSTDGSLRNSGFGPFSTENVMKRKICMFVTNSVTNDPRVRRECATLFEAGYQVVVIGVRGEGDGQEDWLDGYQIIRLPYPKLSRPRQGLLALFARIAPGPYNTLRSYYRRVCCRQAAEAPATVPQTDRTSRATFRSRLRAHLERMRGELFNIRMIFWLN